MTMKHPEDRNRLLTATDDELLAHCRMDVARGTGPGGQKRNRTESAVRLTVEDTTIQVLCDQSRSQHRNRELALRELRLRLALECRFPTRESMPWSDPPPVKQPEFTLWIAQVLDVVAGHGWRVGDAVQAMDVSTNRFSQAVLTDDRVARVVNRERERNGMRPLKRPE